MREIITLQCPTCKNRNYSTTKNKKTTTGRLEFSKFCNTCRKHTAHKERSNERLLARTGGVSSTVKLSVSKTELLGSNPSSPASFRLRCSPEAIRQKHQRRLSVQG
jgi:large subunit ribosomal protein L33